ncbi:MAG: diguanylate cyclase, partial [Planctomycetota bacterium]
MNPVALTVAFMSEDSKFLREATWWMSAFGYRVSAFREFSDLESMWRIWRPDFLLVDSDHPDAEQTVELPEAVGDKFTYRVLACDLDRPLDEVAGLESGFNDAIEKPLNHGEALARLRAGAETLEYERRRLLHAFRDEATGLYSRRGLEQALVEGPLVGRRVDDAAMILIELDHFRLLADSLAGSDVAKLLRDVASALSQVVEGRGWTARASESTLAVALPQATDDDAHALAETIGKELRNASFRVGGDPIAVSPSACFARWRRGEAS